MGRQDRLGMSENAALDSGLRPEGTSQRLERSSEFGKSRRCRVSRLAGPAGGKMLCLSSGNTKQGWFRHAFQSSQRAAFVFNAC